MDKRVLINGRITHVSDRQKPVVPQLDALNDRVLGGDDMPVDLPNSAPCLRLLVAGLGWPPNARILRVGLPR